MQSRISCFNGTLFRKNLSRFWPLWGLASFVGALFPLALFLQLMREHTRILPQEMTDVYYSAVSWVLPALTLCYAVLCAMTVWSYLYNARSVSLMHTLPIQRRGIFFTNFLSGMAMMLIPYAVTGVLCILVSLYGHAFDPVGLGIAVLAVAGESFFYFASATFVAFVTGNIFALPALYFLLHFLAVLADFLVSSFAQGFLFGFNSSYTGVVEFLSPTVYLTHHLHVNREYVETMTESGYSSQALSAVSLENGWLIAVYALAGAVLLALAYGAYRRRHSESAGDVMAVRWLRPVFRWGITVLSGTLGGLVLYELFWRSFQYSPTYEALPMTVCVAVAGIIGYYAASMLLAKSLRVFRGSWKSILAVVVLSVAFCAALHFDVLGIESRIPTLDQVKRVELRVDGNTYTLYPGEDDALIRQVQDLHRAITADEAYIREMDSDGPWPVEEGNVSYGNSLRLVYVLRTGVTVERFYSLTITRDRLAQSGTYDAMLDALVRNETMKQKRLHLGGDGYTPDGGSIYVEHRGEGYDLGSREAQAILNAVAQDAAVGAWGDADWFGSNDGGDYALNLDLSFTRQEKNNTYNDWITITVRPSMTYTTACLKKLGLVTEQDLVTWAQMDPARYDTGETYEETAQAGIPDTAQVIYPEEQTVEALPSAEPGTTAAVTGLVVLNA